MITLTAKIEINQENPVPFTIGESVIGGNSLIGETINVTKEFDRRNLLSIERSIFDRSDLKLPSWGIISNVGRLEFNDANNRFLGYANAGLLVEGMKCELYLNNTLAKGATEKIGTFYTDTWDYDNDNRVVSVSLKDDLEEWQEINVAEIKYEPNKPQHKSFAYFYEILWSLTSNREYNGVKGNGKYNMLALGELDGYTGEVLYNTRIKYPLLNYGSLWAQWTKLCQVCQLHIYKNSDGIIVCRYNGGN